MKRIVASTKINSAENIDYSDAINDFFDSIPGKTYKTHELLEYLMNRFGVSQSEAKKIYDDWDSQGSDSEESDYNYTRYFKFLDTLQAESEARATGLSHAPEYYLARKFNIPESKAKKIVDAYNVEDGEVNASTKIMAAGDWADQPVEDAADIDDEPEEDIEDENPEDAIDDLADAVEDVQDAVDDVQEDDTIIETENNITNHYIAECDVCYGVFISAVIESDQKIDHISGECPLCGKTSEQYLKWLVKKV